MLSMQAHLVILWVPPKAHSGFPFPSFNVIGSVFSLKFPKEQICLSTLQCIPKPQLSSDFILSQDTKVNLFFLKLLLLKYFIWHIYLKCIFLGYLNGSWLIFLLKGFRTRIPKMYDSGMWTILSWRHWETLWSQEKLLLI